MNSLPLGFIEQHRNSCPKCGGTIIGDGYTSPEHCEFAEVDPWVEADAPAVLCTFGDES